MNSIQPSLLNTVFIELDRMYKHALNSRKLSIIFLACIINNNIENVVCNVSIH